MRLFDFFFITVSTRYKYDVPLTKSIYNPILHIHEVSKTIKFADDKIQKLTVSRYLY